MCIGGSSFGVAESDVRVIYTNPDRKVDICGICNHEITVMPLVTTEGVTSTITGEVIAIMHQHAWHGKNKTIYSLPQMEHCKNIVDDCSIRVGGGQHISTLDKFKIPMSIRGASPYMPFSPCTNEECEKLPHVIFTSDKD